jgi:lipoate-protein ligase A
LESREKRVLQLEKVLKSIQQKVDNHYSGVKPIEKQTSLEHLEQKLRASQHQVEELSRELDEEQIQEMIERYEEMQKSRKHREL